MVALFLSRMLTSNFLLETQALCFARKPEFDAANYAAKKRIASEIVHHMVSTHGTKFLRKKTTDGGWKVLTQHKATLKAAQVMRDFRRPDRAAARQACKKRNSATATPMDGVPAENTVLAPILELPQGVHAHDILSGRGAFVNEHGGNIRLRTLCSERRDQFMAGTYAEKRALASEIVYLIHSLDPPGRFLKKSNGKNEWEELSDEKAIQKTCQVMRDIRRPDRLERDEQRRLRKLGKERSSPDDGSASTGTTPSYPNTENGSEDGNLGVLAASVLLPRNSEGQDRDVVSGEEELPSTVVDEAVAAATEAMSKFARSIPSPSMHRHHQHHHGQTT